MKIVVSGSHEIFGKGIYLALEEEFSQFRIENCSSGSELKAADAAVMVMDIDGQGGFNDRIRFMKEEAPQVKFLLFASELKQHNFEEILNLEIDGFLLKDVGVDELYRAIYKLMSEERYYDQRIIQYLINQKSNPQTSRNISDDKITPKQKKILKLIAEEHTNKEIAEKLGISPRTVDGHRYRLIKRFGVKNTAGLIRHAINTGLLAEV